MPSYNDKQKIINQYDVISPYYRELWGEHIHHGYWKTGSESKEEAQVALTAHLAEAAQIKPKSAILDVGCGIGGSSIYLATTYQAAVTGITISPVQAEMARQAAERAKITARFLVMDAEQMTLGEKFDVVWSIEAISHFAKKAEFFAQTAKLLKPGGTLAVIDWFKREHLSLAKHQAYIMPIERGMLVELNTVADYCEMIQAGSLEIVERSVLNAHCAKTWDISLEIIKNPALWEVASNHGVEFVRYLRSFNAMRRGFASGNFIYGMIVARKN